MKTAQRENRALFAEALTEALSRKYEAALSSATAATPAEAYHAKVRQTILKARSDAFRKRLLTALLAAALLLLASCTAHYVYTEFETFFVKDNGKDADLFFQGVQDAPVILEETYVLSYVPEGYSLQTVGGNRIIREFLYKNEQGATLFFAQGTMKSLINVDTERSEYTVLNCGTHEIFFHTSNDQNFFYLWTDGKYKFFISTPTKFTSQELQCIIEGLVREA